MSLQGVEVLYEFGPEAYPLPRHAGHLVYYARRGTRPAGFWWVPAKGVSAPMPMGNRS